MKSDAAGLGGGGKQKKSRSFFSFTKIIFFASFQYVKKWSPAKIYFPEMFKIW